MSKQGDEDGWAFQRASAEDMDVLMSWFTSRAEVSIWGGPNFHYPYTQASFRTDCHWPEMDSFTLCDPHGELCAFGQLYNRNERINLARLVVRRDRRGQGIGRRLIRALMAIGPELLPLDEFSLFVYRNNTAALECYQSMGFEIQEYPPDQILKDECFYLTRRVTA